MGKLWRLGGGAVVALMIVAATSLVGATAAYAYAGTSTNWHSDVCLHSNKAGSVYTGLDP
ncbi:hypothetical protein ACQEVZ_39430 [Dactylosporangium sp. CA-152071]|uniref:hypothetical protein n=1 Tax=Dactylosporangium sp. CA-152071 TaxID=3239933 RepID=UPI003D8C6683